MPENKEYKTTIGGQALIEGVMMRGTELTALAVRTPDGEISVDTFANKNASAWYKKVPFLRGSFNFIGSMLLGYRCLMKSAEIAGLEDEEPSKFEKKLSELFGEKSSAVLSVLVTIAGLAIAVGLFMVLPTFVVRLAGSQIQSNVVLSLIEGVIKIGLFTGYLIAVSKLEDIKRVFQYHGAEHKTIACYEAGCELTVENVRGRSRFHPRCGTSFLLIVLVISILVFSVVTWNHVLLRVLIKLLMLPVVVGISYEIIKFAGRHDNVLTRAISAPGLWMQRFTTYEPDDSQIEVAIASMLPVLPKVQGEDAW